MSKLASFVSSSQPPFPPDPIPRIILGGSVNLLAGASGVGKTALLAGLLTLLRDQQPIFGHTPNPVAAIGMLSLDRSWHQSSQLWFDLAGFPDIPRYCLQDDRAFNVDRLEFKRQRMKILQECLDALALPWGAVLAIDPLSWFLGGNLNDYDACMVACTRIRRLCMERGLTIIGLSHAGKQKADPKHRYLRAQDRIVGSAAQFGYTDTQMYLAGPVETGEKWYTFLWNPHHAPEESFQLGRTPEGLFIPWDLSQIAQDEEALYAAIPPAPGMVSFGELVVQSGVSRATVHRTLQDWVKRGLVARVGHGQYCKPSPN